MPEIATYIARVKSAKGHRGRKRKSQEQEPNFYEETKSNLEEALAKATGRTSREDESDQALLNQAPLLPVHQLRDISSGLGRLEPTPIQELVVPGDGNLGLQESSLDVATVKSPFEQGRPGSYRPRGVQEAKGHESSPQSMSAVQQMLQHQGQGFLRGATRSVHDHPLGSQPPTAIGAQWPCTDISSQGVDIFGGLGSLIGNSGADTFLPVSNDSQRRPSLPYNRRFQMETPQHAGHQGQNPEQLCLEDQMHNHILQQLAQQNQMRSQQQEFSQSALLQNREQQQVHLQQQQPRRGQLQRDLGHAFAPEFQLPVVPRNILRFSELAILRQHLLEPAQDEARQEGKQNEGSHYESGGYRSFDQDR